MKGVQFEANHCLDRVPLNHDAMWLGARSTDMIEIDQIQGLITNILVGKVHVEVPSPTTDLMKAGVIDSITLVELIVGIEEQFGIQVPLEEIEIDHFRSVEVMADFVSSYVARESGKQVYPHRLNNGETDR
jgi:D-alanine--poly(phosphoribitol) ligase subunit 2